MTPQQKQMLEYIRDYHAEHGIAPSTRTIMRGLDHKSPGSVHQMLVVLESNGWLIRTNEGVGKYLPAELPAPLASISSAELHRELRRRREARG